MGFREYLGFKIGLGAVELKVFGVEECRSLGSRSLRHLELMNEHQARCHCLHAVWDAG